eukprot:7251905-Heterocapsa_arctica.AAC.1
MQAGSEFYSEVRAAKIARRETNLPSGEALAELGFCRFARRCGEEREDSGGWGGTPRLVGVRPLAPL